jgi:hypothetical protein
MTTFTGSSAPPANEHNINQARTNNCFIRQTTYKAAKLLKNKQQNEENIKN